MLTTLYYYHCTMFNLKLYIMKNLINFPVEIQNEIKETLKWFQGCYATNERVSTGLGISDSYSNSESEVTYFKNTDIYTESEIDSFIAQM